MNSSPRGKLKEQKHDGDLLDNTVYGELKLSEKLSIEIAKVREEKE